MISMYAQYSGRTLYVALSTDTIEGAKNGDTRYEMDTGKRYVYNETSDSWDEQPEEGGGGGGGGSTIVSKTITANGTYYASSDSADGYNPVTVNVPAPHPAMENLVFKLRNQIGINMGFISMYYDTNDSNITLFIYAQQSTNTSVQKTCLIQNGKVQLAYTNNREITSITHNGNPVPFTQSGSGQRRYVEFDVPANFDPDIDIIFS